jgi:uncharacterized protein (TIGR02597 family)
MPCIVTAGSLQSQTTVTTDPVGFTTTSCRGNSDTYVSIPFTRPPEFTGTIQAISSNPANALTVNGTPGWTQGQFAYTAGTQSKHYYLLLGTGGTANPKEGHIFPVTGNGSNTLTVDTTMEDLGGVTANTQITIIPYWTPATIFPPSDASISFTPTSSPPSYQTLLRVPNYSAPGINQPYAAEYYFNNGSWQRVTPAGVGDDDPLLPDGYFVIRNANGAPTLPLIALGSVLTKKLAVPILTASNQQQDNAVALIRPISVPLVSTGLAPIDESFTENDQLLLFDNTQPGFNKTPSAIYVFSNGWRLSTDLNTDRGNDVVPPGSALLVRKAASPDGTLFFSNSPTYITAQPVTTLQVASRKVHGAMGPFNVNLPATLNPGVECRTAGSNNSYSLIYTMDRAISAADSAILTQGNGNPPTITRGPNPNQVTVTLTGVTNIQQLVVALNGVHDTQGGVLAAVSTRMDVLIGDVNSSRHVDAGDVGAIQRQNSKPITLSNFRMDLNGSGHIDAGDVGIAQRQNSTGL